MDDKSIKIGERIRQQRAIKGYKQEYMAFQLNISQNAYSKIERGESQVTLIRVYDIAEILEIPVYDLIPKTKGGTGLNFNGLKRYWRKFRSLFIKNKIPD